MRVVTLGAATARNVVFGEGRERHCDNKSKTN